MQVSLINSSIISIVVIVIGIMFDVLCSSVQSDVQYLGNNCLSVSNGVNNNSQMLVQAQTFKSNLLINMANGLSTGFSIAIGIIGAIQAFLIIALGVVNLI